MQLPQSLKSGKLIKRYKRFFADLEYNNNPITAHCPNPGAMTGVNQPGQEVLFSTTDNPKRKLKFFKGEFKNILDVFEKYEIRNYF